MAGVDKFGVIFTIAFVAAMIAIMGGFLQVDTTPSTPNAYTPTQTYSSTPIATQPSGSPQAAPQTSDSDNMKYTIRGGIVNSISQDEKHNAVKIMMESKFDGQLIITLTSDSVTPFDDGTYFVTIDGEEVEFTQVGNNLTIDFMANSKKIMIYGDGYKSDGPDTSSMDHSDDSKEQEAMMAADKAAADKAAAAAKAPMAVTIEPVAGSGAPGCEPKCYSPSIATISAGGTVTFKNTDTAPHTATSGSAADGPDGIFDTSLIMINASYPVTLSDSGNYPYFCMVHPWMDGTVIVE
ncbi:MAG: plastocyanin/azurin family copper-binding protein [Crenarchaeota archaeon]|nr:plastocyanin/azurin family copper-binding protein [Thermoproteota archaeon]MDA1124473.1 plastocyanin/azurin family copper-binding protein [Thermoproteota archaeon]